MSEGFQVGQLVRLNLRGTHYSGTITAMTTLTEEEDGWNDQILAVSVLPGQTVIGFEWQATRIEPGELPTDEHFEWAGVVAWRLMEGNY